MHDMAAKQIIKAAYFLKKIVMKFRKQSSKSLSNLSHMQWYDCLIESYLTMADYSIAGLSVDIQKIIDSGCYTFILY